MTQGIFLYFLDGIKFEEVKRETLSKNLFLAGPFFELIHSPKVFRERLVGGNVIRGPEGKGGCVVGIQPQVETDQSPSYLPDRQTWTKFGEQHVGYQTDMKPGPESLRRASLIAGYDVELGDGQIWKAPVIRPFHENIKDWGCSLPMMISLDTAAKRTSRVVERYRFAWDLSARVADILINGKSGNLFDMYGDACAAMSLNYRIGEAEAGLLELFDTRSIEEALRATVDGPLIDEFLAQETDKNPPSPPESVSS